MTLFRFFTLSLLCSLTLTSGCAENDSNSPWIWEPTNGWEAANGRGDASAAAVFLDFSWEAEVESNHCWNPREIIKSQALYTVGQLNGFDSVGRLDQMQVTNVEKESNSEGGCTISYSATMPVAWGKRSNIPADFAFLLPRNLSMSGQEEFLERYEFGCLDWHAHDVTAGIMWYYYRPNLHNCQLAPEDIVAAKAIVDVSAIQTEGKYPEYHKIWEDDVLEVVAIFGKYKDGATRNGDAGISAWNSFNEQMKLKLLDWQVNTVPETILLKPGVEQPEIRYEAKHPDGRRMIIHGFLIDSVKAAPFTFWNRYEELTPTADFIVYNGHSGLGSNIRLLANRGEWSEGQYSVVFMNGCDTYAYIDSALADAHAEVNPDDDEGTKYVDIVANAMPSMFIDMPSATFALMDAFLNREEPATYEEIFKKIPAREVVLVTGEHDNEFEPGLF